MDKNDETHTVIHAGCAGWDDGERCWKMNEGSEESRKAEREMWVSRVILIFFCLLSVMAGEMELFRKRLKDGKRGEGVNLESNSLN